MNTLTEVNEILFSDSGLCLKQAIKLKRQIVRLTVRTRGNRRTFWTVSELLSVTFENEMRSFLDDEKLSFCIIKKNLTSETSFLIETNDINKPSVFPCELRFRRIRTKNVFFLSESG